MSFPTANDIQLPMRHGHWTSTKALRADRQGSFGDTVQTDHKPLERIFGLKTAILLLARSDASTVLGNYSAFNYSIKFVPSKKNAVAAGCQDFPCRQRPMMKILHTMLKSG